MDGTLKAGPSGGAQHAKRRTLSPAATVACALTIALVCINVWWMHARRSGTGFDIDEANYLSIALNNFVAWHTGGLHGLWFTVSHEQIQPPLVPFVSSLPSIILGHTTLLGSFLTQDLALVVCVFAGYGIAARVAGPAAGIVSAVAIAGAPVVVDYSRSYSFALPAAAMFTTAVWSQMRSSGHTRLWWSVLWGTAVGAMTITRSMTLAFVAGFLAVAVAQAAVAPDRRRAWAGVSLGVAAGLVVAAPWWLFDGAGAWHYLTSAGYGAASSSYGPPRSELSPASWSQFAHSNVTHYIGIPLAIVLLLGAFSLCAEAARRFRHGHISVSAVLSSAWLCPTVAVGAGLLALMSSRNKGSAFIAPLVPTMCATAVAAQFRWFRARWAYALVVALVVIAAVPTYVLKTFDGGNAYGPPTLSVDVPGWGATTVYDAKGTYDTYLTMGGGGGVDRSAWVNANYRALDRLWSLEKRTGSSVTVVVGFNARQLNVNTLALYSLVRRGAPLLPVLLAAGPNPVDRVALASQFDADEGTGREIAILTCDTRQVFPPSISCASEQGGASLAGLREIATQRLPDGSSLQFWTNGPESSHSRT